MASAKLPDRIAELLGIRDDALPPPASLPGLTWLDPAIHHFRKGMDARVKPDRR
jgi:hypothetical protein